jgi:hypothetical protein
MLAVLVVGSEPMNRTASRAATANLIDGRTEKMPVTLTLCFGIEMAAPRRKRRARQDEPSSREVGSVMRIPKRLQMPRTINHSYATENGAVIDTAQTAIGPAVPNSSKSPSGWIATTAMSHDVHTRRKILSAGRKG